MLLHYKSFKFNAHPEKLQWIQHMLRLMNTGGSGSKIAYIYMLLILREIRCSENYEYKSILRVYLNIKGASLF